MRAALFKRNHIECRRMRVINVVDLYLYPAPLYWVPPCPPPLIRGMSILDFGCTEHTSPSLQVAFVLGLFNTFLWISLLTLVNNTLRRYWVGGLCWLSLPKVEVFTVLMGNQPVRKFPYTT